MDELDDLTIEEINKSGLTLSQWKQTCKDNQAENDWLDNNY